MCTPSSFSTGGGGGEWFEPSAKFSKRRGLTASQMVVVEKDRAEFFQWGCSFYIKNDKKGL